MNLLIGNFLFGIGYQIFFVSIVLWAKLHFNSGATIAHFLVMNTITMLIVEPIAGAWADAGRRDGMLRWSLSLPLSGLVVCLMSTWILKAMPWPLFALSTICYGMTFSILRPTVYSMPVRGVSTSQLVQSQSAWLQTGDMASIVIGQTCGALLFTALGVAGTLMVCLATLSAALVLFHRIPKSQMSSCTKAVIKPENVLKTVIGAGQLIWRKNDIRALFTVLMIINIFFPGLVVLLPFLITDTLHLSVVWVGYCLAMQGLGFCAGSLLNQCQFISENRHLCFIMALSMMGAMVIAIAYMQYVIYIMVLMFGIGFCLSMTNISVISQLRLNVAPEFHGRILAYLMFFAGAFSPISYAGAGILVDVYKRPGNIYQIIGAVLLACGFLMWGMKSIRQFFCREVVLMRD